MATGEQTDTILLTVVAPKHGGIVIYEQTADGEQTTVFGGNLADATKYFEARGAELQIRSEQKPSPNAGDGGRVASAKSFSIAANGAAERKAAEAAK